MNYAQEIQSLREVNATLVRANDIILTSAELLEKIGPDIYEAMIGCHGEFKAALEAAMQSIEIVSKFIDESPADSIADQLMIVEALGECNNQHQTISNTINSASARLLAVVNKRAGVHTLH